MHDFSAIVLGAFQSRLKDLADEYGEMQMLSHLERDAYVRALQVQADEIELQIEGAGVCNAKSVLLKFQFASRIIYKRQGTGKNHFFDEYKWERWDVTKQISSWRWTSPSEQEFARVMLSWCEQVDFYTQVDELCSETFGLPIPRESESFSEYLQRSCVAEASWEWRYDSAEREERGRWFPSRKKLADIEDQRILQRRNANRCEAFLATIFSRIQPASDTLRSVQRSELSITSRLSAALRVQKALAENVQLKHLLLEEGVTLAGSYEQVTRGL